MIDIILVEDNDPKAHTVIKLLVDGLMLDEELIKRVNNIKSAKKLMVDKCYDLLILDLVLPLEEGDEPSPENGARFLRDINFIPRIMPPVHIIGLTEFNEFRNKFSDDFSDNLWHLIDYKASEINWQDKLERIITHLISTKESFHRKIETSLKVVSTQVSKTNISITTPSVMQKVFVSHASENKLIANEFVELLELIGLQEEQIFYSSDPDLGIVPGADFLNTIKGELSDEVLVIFLLSDEFYKSTICICEMGAAWALSKEHIPVLIPPFKYEQISGVIPLTQGIRLNDASQLNALAKTIATHFDLPSPVERANWEKKRTRITDRIQRLIDRL